MASLLLAADAAYPFDYRRLPRGVAAILGYVGHPDGTPHVWTASEVRAARASGRLWAPIWTPPAAVLNEQLGRQAADEMLTTLARYPLLGREPVFLDIEQHVYAAAPAGALAAAKAWAQTMTGHGWPYAVPYLPHQAGTGWAANWTGRRPDTLPAGLTGWQYAGELDGDRYDLSVFRPAVFAPLQAAMKGHPVQLDTQDQAWIVAQLDKVRDQIMLRLNGIAYDGEPGVKHGNALSHVHADVRAILAKVDAPPAASWTVADLARQLTADLGPTLARDLAVELGKRLSNG